MRIDIGVSVALFLSLSPSTDITGMYVCASCDPLAHHVVFAHVQGTSPCQSSGEIRIRSRFDDDQIMIVFVEEEMRTTVVKILLT